MSRPWFKFVWLSDLLLLAACAFAIVISLDAMVAWLVQGTNHWYGENRTERFRVFACVANAALALALSFTSLSVVVRFVQLRLTRTGSRLLHLGRSLLDHGVLGAAIFLLMTMTGSPRFLMDFVWALVIRACGI